MRHESDPLDVVSTLQPAVVVVDVDVAELRAVWQRLNDAPLPTLGARRRRWPRRDRERERERGGR